MDRAIEWMWANTRFNVTQSDATQSAMSVTTDRPDITAVVTNYNGMDCLDRTLSSLAHYASTFAEIIVVDDGSTDGSCEYIRTHFPQVRLIPLERNTANLAVVRNTGLKAAATRYVYLTDNDIVLRPGCVERLFHTLTSVPRAFSVTPRLFDQDHPEVVYQSGNAMHYLGVSVGSQRGTSAAFSSPKIRHSMGGGIMLLDLHAVRELGYFDTGYVHGWADDAELHLRGQLAGYESLHDPVAEAEVKVRSHGTRRALGQYHNRLRLIFTTYAGSSLLALSPVLTVFEGMLLLSAVVCGTLPMYLRAWRKIIAEVSDLSATRARIQRQRRTADRQLLQSGEFEFPGLHRFPRMARRIVWTAQQGTAAFWWLAYPFLGSRGPRTPPTHV